MTKVGFIGLGEQGKPMAVNLAAADGFDLMVYDLRKEPLDELVALGARRAGSPREVGAHAELVEVIVVDDAQVEAVVLGDEGVIAGARPGSVIAIHSTIRPATIRKIAAACAVKGVELIDAPVSGGARGAHTRTMSYMVGGDKELISKWRPIFLTSGSRIFHLGPLGAGMVAKLAHQVIVGLNVLAAGEGMMLAKKAGLDLGTMQEVVRAGGASSRIADNWVKHQPSANAGKLWRKDLILALECAEELGLGLQGASAAQQLIEKVLVND
jgi:3-hydroxyisobutyrate dehydrogenase-like beta-hydroxyacid dehydrogenase